MIYFLRLWMNMFPSKKVTSQQVSRIGNWVQTIFSQNVVSHNILCSLRFSIFTTKAIRFQVNKLINVKFVYITIFGHCNKKKDILCLAMLA